MHLPPFNRKHRHTSHDRLASETTGHTCTTPATGITTLEDLQAALPDLDGAGYGSFRYDGTPQGIRYDNRRRAGFAAAPVVLYAQRNYPNGGEDLATVITDFLGDLRHLCDLLGEDFYDLSDRGNVHYVAECAGVP